MIILGIILLIAGFVLRKMSILWTIGIILLVIGAVLWILGSMGRAVGGRRRYLSTGHRHQAPYPIRRHMKRRTANTTATTAAALQRGYREPTTAVIR